MTRAHSLGQRSRLGIASPRTTKCDLTIELLEPRTLLSGLPTMIDIAVGAGASSPQEFTNVNNIVFFVASTSTEGEELWKSDGTAAGTVLVKDIRPGASGSNIAGLTNVNGTLFFAQRRHERL